METTQKIELPVSGESLAYPFDRYRLRLGVIMERVFTDQTTQILSPEDARGHLFLTLRPHVPRPSWVSPRQYAPQSVRPLGTSYQYVSVEDLALERPLYLKAVTVLLVVLISAAAAYAVFMRPFEQLLGNTGGLVLSVWGIRAVLLGTSVPGVTAVDLALAVVIILLLVAITVRALQFLGNSTKLSCA